MVKSRFIFALLSAVFPFATVAGVLAYQSVAHANFWRSLTPDESAAGAMMAFGEVVQLVIFTTVGCIIGFVLAGFSLSLQGRKRVVSVLAYAGLVVNALPLLLGFGVLVAASR